jgi:hypothetical protein
MSHAPAACGRLTARQLPSLSYILSPPRQNAADLSSQFARSSGL